MEKRRKLKERPKIPLSTAIGMGSLAAHPLPSPPPLITRRDFSSQRQSCTAMRPLSYAPPAPQSPVNPSRGRSPRPQPCGLLFPDALRVAAAAAAVSLSLLTGDAVGAAVVAQPTEVCRDGGAAVVEEVRAEAVTNAQLVEEA